MKQESVDKQLAAIDRQVKRIEQEMATVRFEREEGELTAWSAAHILDGYKEALADYAKARAVFEKMAEGVVTEPAEG